MHHLEYLTISASSQLFNEFVVFGNWLIAYFDHVLQVERKVNWLSGFHRFYRLYSHSIIMIEKAIPQIKKVLFYLEEFCFEIMFKLIYRIFRCFCPADINKLGMNKNKKY